MESWQGISDRALGTSCLIAMTAMTAFGAWRAVFGRASMIPGAMRPQHNENTCEFPNCDNNNAERRDCDNDFKATSRRRRRLRLRMPRAAGFGACDGAEKFGKARASAKKRSTPPGQHSPHRPCTTKPLPAPLHVNPPTKRTLFSTHYIRYACTLDHLIEPLLSRPSLTQPCAAFAQPIAPHPRHHNKSTTMADASATPTFKLVLVGDGGTGKVRTPLST
jgi:hypothetical protein